LSPLTPALSHGGERVKSALAAFNFGIRVKMFNALAYANKLKEAGFTDKQAEVQAKELE